MSQTISEFNGRPYGVQRVCQIWEQARSTFYERTQRTLQSPERTLCRRGPRPGVCDEELLELIRRDLAASPFHGEGHRKVWMRLHFVQGIPVSRKRVLRIMRENQLLSPYRAPSREPRAHDGTIVTLAPNVMWGTDGARVFTLEEGWVWLFVAVEHWNAECVGWHVSKRGTRFAALEPLSQALSNLYTSVGPGVARGLALRMDHGTQYLSDHFVRPLQYWGITPSFAFLCEPQTNGVAERFIRTLKEQAIYGRIFRNVEELRRAVGSFVEAYNEQWLPEKNRGHSPRDLRRCWLAAENTAAA